RCHGHRMKSVFRRRRRSVDGQPEESAAPGGSVDNHPAESLDLRRLTVQRDGNTAVSGKGPVPPVPSEPSKGAQPRGRSPSRDATAAPAIKNWAPPPLSRPRRQLSWRCRARPNRRARRLETSSAFVGPSVTRIRPLPADQRTTTQPNGSIYSGSLSN